MEQYKISYLGDLRTECTRSNGTRILTDASKSNQGKGEEFSPLDLLAVSLGSCMLTIMAIYARKLNVDLEKAQVDVQNEISMESHRIVRFIVRFSSPARLSKDIQKKLETAAIHCPVHESLHPDIQQEIYFSWGS